VEVNQVNGQQTAEASKAFIEEAMARIKGTGQQQYGMGDTQKFEVMTLPELFQYAREELLDEVNYLMFLAVRLERLEASFAMRQPDPEDIAPSHTPTARRVRRQRATQPAPVLEPDPETMAPTPAASAKRKRDTDTLSESLKAVGAKLKKHNP
jgi:predicted component of type VI protein secretion system